MSSRWLAVTLLALGLSVALAQGARAQLYRWTNDRGEVHFTQGLESVPERFRAGARLLGYPEAPPSAAAAPAKEPARRGRGTARIPFVPGQPVLVDVRINAGRSVRLMLDTGAALTMIAPRALSALGVDMSRSRSAEVRGVTGSTTARIVYLETLAVGEARVGPLWVLAHDAHLAQGDGLLGRDFLDRFTVTVDPRERVVTLSER
jgi:hypothetical protein